MEGREERGEEEARATFFRTYKEQQQAEKWRAIREAAGRLPVVATERREAERPIMGRKLKGIPYEFHRCRSAEELRASA